METIPLTKGLVALVDDEDAAAVNRHRWRAYVNPKNKTAYAIRNVKNGFGIRTTQFLHTYLALRMGIVGEVDHKDRNGLNCTRENLRQATSSQNTCNGSLRRDNSSGVKGVWWDKRSERWCASVAFEGKRHFVGLFEDLEKARVATNVKRKELHGEFASDGI